MGTVEEVKEGKEGEEEGLDEEVLSWRTDQIPEDALRRILGSLVGAQLVVKLGQGLPRSTLQIYPVHELDRRSPYEVVRELWEVEEPDLATVGQLRSVLTAQRF